MENCEFNNDSSYAELGTTILTVVGAVYDTKKFKKLSTAYNHSVKLSLPISIISSILIFIFTQ